MKAKLIKIINDLSGDVIGFGITDKNILKCLKTNKKILNCNIFTIPASFWPRFLRRDDDNSNSTKKTSMKKIKKQYKNAKANFVIIDLDEVILNLRRVMQLSLKITKGKVIIYGSKENYDYELVKSRYHRYSQNIEVIDDEEKYILMVDLTKPKKHFFLKPIYYFLDITVDFLNLFSDLLVK